MIIIVDGFLCCGKIVFLKDEVDKVCEYCLIVEKVVIVCYVGNDFILYNYDFLWSMLEKEKLFIYVEEM